MTPDKNGKVLAQFNVKNAVYNIDGSSDIKPLTWMNTFTKDRNINVTPLYGDGEVQVSLYADTTITGAIGTTARDEEFEKEIGLALALADKSLGEIAINSVKKINFGFETEIVGKDGKVKVKKVWVFNVQVSPPNESLTQTQENITQSTTDYNYTGYGVNAKSEDGKADYINPETGKTVRVYTASKKPTDDGYAEFLATVPTPKMLAQTQTTTQAQTSKE
ncbi:MAG: hypothetical protein K2N23_07010 [Clostridia bacterium]|nr:hypothetical protein [Clostridia bacterium]